MPNIKLALPAATCALLFSASASAFSIDSMLGKSQAATTAAEPTTSYCIVENIEDIKQCPNGQMLLYAPSQFGNKQLPLMVIAAVCDENGPIVYNEGGVVCRKIQSRKMVNPQQDALKAQWEELRNTVLATGSGYEKWDDGSYSKLTKLGTEQTPEIPYKATIKVQMLDVKGNPQGKPEILEDVVTLEKKEKPIAKPAGTEYDTVIFDSNLVNSHRVRVSVEKTEPIAKKSEKPQKKAKR